MSRVWRVCCRLANGRVWTKGLLLILWLLLILLWMVSPPLTAVKNIANLVDLKGEKGVYLDDCQLKRPSKWASDPEKAERLWKLSEELVGQKFDLGVKSRL
jgi:hypothetical protein